MGLDYAGGTRHDVITEGIFASWRTGASELYLSLMKARHE